MTTSTDTPARRIVLSRSMTLYRRNDGLSHGFDFIDVPRGEYPAEPEWVGESLWLCLRNVPGHEHETIGLRKEKWLKMDKVATLIGFDQAGEAKAPDVSPVAESPPAAAGRPDNPEVTAEDIQALARRNASLAPIWNDFITLQPDPAPAPELVDIVWGRMALVREESPQFTHDCESCTFLGRYRGDGPDHDLYYCDTPPAGPTILARWSGDGPRYTSGIAQAQAGDPVLIEAYRRAEARGLNLETTFNAVVISEAFRNRHAAKADGGPVPSPAAAHPGRADLGVSAAGPADIDALADRIAAGTANYGFCAEEDEEAISDLIEEETSARGGPGSEANHAGVRRWVAGVLRGAYFDSLPVAERDAAFAALWDENRRLMAKRIEARRAIMLAMRQVDDRKNLWPPGTHYLKAIGPFVSRLATERDAARGEASRLRLEVYRQQHIAREIARRLIRPDGRRLYDGRGEELDFIPNGRWIGPVHGSSSMRPGEPADASYKSEDEALRAVLDIAEKLVAGRDWSDGLGAPPGGVAGRPGPVDPSPSRPSGDLAGIEERTGERVGGQQP